MTQHQLGWQIFTDLCLSAKKPQTLNLLLDVFLTLEEKSNIAMRCLIIKNLLEKEKTQRKIAQELNVSIAKITRGSNELKRLDSKTLEQLKKYL